MCKTIFRTERKLQPKVVVKCPNCGTMVINILELKVGAFIVMDEIKLRYAR